MKEALILARISDVNQVDGYSLESQIRQAREWCLEHKLKIRKEFEFQETASKSAERRKFHELLKEAWKNPSNTIIVVEKRDRLSRNFSDREAVKALIKYGLEIDFFKERKKLNRHSDPSEWLVDGVMTSVNEYQALNIGREAKKGMIERARQGQPVFKPYFGYEYQWSGDLNAKRRRRSELVPLPWIRPLYLRMYELRLDGFSLPEVRKIVLEEGLVPSERIKTFYHSTVDKILKNPAYAGRFNFNGELFEGKFESMIAWEEWLRLQKTFEKKGFYKRRDGPLFQGLIECDECGCKISYEEHTKKSGRKYGYYRCANGKRIHKRLTYVKQDDILSQLEAALDLIKIPVEWGKMIADHLNKESYNSKQRNEALMEKYMAELADVKRREDTLIDLFSKSMIAEDVLREKLKELSTLRDDCKLKIHRQNTQSAEDDKHTAASILELAKSAKDLVKLAEPQEKLKILNMVLLNYRLDGLTMRFKIKKPFEVLAQMVEKKDWRSQGDLNPCILREREVS